MAVLSRLFSIDLTNSTPLEVEARKWALAYILMDTFDEARLLKTLYSVYWKLIPEQPESCTLW